MRRVWERQATVFPGRATPADVTSEAIAKAETDAAADQNRRKTLIDLFALHARAGDLGRASDLAERWAEKEALDPEALTARADLAARRGDREQAIRILGSVIDVRPGDLPSLERLARLHRWAGEPERACRYLMSVAQLRSEDAKSVAAAVRCSRETGQSALANEILRLASDRVKAAAERAVGESIAADTVRGEIQLSATWQVGQDVDLALIDPDGRRVSWLGAPTRAIISAADVTAAGRERLGLMGSLAGEYVIEVVRARGEGPVQGEIVVQVPGGTRTIPFSLVGDRASVGTLRISWTSRLVPM
jgi:tetratricopeptide (TPR) repeat protein